MRRLFDRAFTLLVVSAGLLALMLFVAIAGYLAWRGLGAVDLDFLTQPSRGAGAEGGVRYQLLGTLILIATALAAAVPPALGIGIYRGVYLTRPQARRRVSLLLFVANGVPSILYGIFGLAVFGQLLGWGKSWLAGGLLLGMMILPTLTLAFAERVDAIPKKYLEAAAGLGLRRAQIVRAVILPQSLGGLVSGALLGLARAAGETAPILFIAAVFSGATVPHGIVESPVLALPYHIFVLAQDSFQPEAETHLWAAAAVLLGVVLVFALVALPLRIRLHEEAHHG